MEVKFTAHGFSTEPNYALIDICAMLEDVAKQLAVYVEEVDTEPGLPLLMQMRSDFGRGYFRFATLTEGSGVIKSVEQGLLFAAKQALMALDEGYDAPKIRSDLQVAIAEVEKQMA